MALHLLTRETSQITAAHRITALRKSLLSSMSKLRVFLLALVRSLAVFSRWLG
jgi:hypothetical protein